MSKAVESSAWESIASVSSASVDCACMSLSIVFSVDLVSCVGDLESASSKLMSSKPTSPKSMSSKLRSPKISSLPISVSAEVCSVSSDIAMLDSSSVRWYSSERALRCSSGEDCKLLSSVFVARSSCESPCKLDGLVGESGFCENASLVCTLAIWATIISRICVGIKGFFMYSLKPLLISSCLEYIRHARLPLISASYAALSIL